MLILASNNDAISLVTGQSASIDVHASWVDNASGAITPGRTNTATISTATVTTIVGSPLLGTQRNVKALFVRNRHATVSCDVTVKHTDGINNLELVKTTLAPGEELIYQDEDGFLQLLAGGGPKEGGTSTVYAGVVSQNILVNGATEIDQPNEGASFTVVNGSTQYPADCWMARYGNASAVLTAQRVADAPPGFTNSVKMTVGTGAAVGSSDYMMFQQGLEANEITLMALGTAGAQQLQLTFWVKSSIGSYTASGHFKNAAGTRSYPFTFSITAPNTWEFKTVPIPGDVTGAWVTSGTAEGARVGFTAAVGSTFAFSAGAWTANNALGATGTTNTLLSTNGSTFQISGAKLEIGAAATPFVREPFAQALQRCQRFYEKSYDPGTALGTVSDSGRSFTIPPTTSAQIPCVFKTTKRVAPTIVAYSPVTGTNGKVRDESVNADLNASVTGTGTGMTDIFATASQGNDLIAVHWTADARF